MERGTEPTSVNLNWHQNTKRTGTAFFTSDGRWTLVTSSLSMVIVGAVAWLAIGTVPPVSSGGLQGADREFYPYRLFKELSGDGNPFAADTARGQGQSAQLDIDLATEGANTPSTETHTVTLESGDTIAALLEQSGVSAADANAALAALRTAFDPRNLRAGQTFELTYKTIPGYTVGDAADGQDAAPNEAAVRLMSIAFSPSVEHEISVTRSADGRFVANDIVKQLVSHAHRAGTAIDSSLYLSAMRAGIPAGIVSQMIHMFSYKVDFQRDIHPGDSFEVFYDYYYTPQGQPAKEGNISYAMMHVGGRDIALYRYQPDPSQPADYFDAHGQSAKGMLMKTPVDGARITSGFGMRFHPILGYSRMHKGIDFGVPIGTPVMAAGAGTIKYEGWENGYGNFVLIDHANGYATAYGHLSRFMPGLHVGSRVRQGQVVAYSGMTGMATGPHLHYEIRIHGQQVNPATVKVADGRLLTGQERRDFLETRMRIDAEIASTKLETKVADLSTDLRTANNPQ